MKGKALKTAGIVFGATILSTLGIAASDHLRGIEGGLGQRASVRDASVCDYGAVPIKINGSIICADMYEASPSERCVHQSLSNIIQSEQNTNTQGCYAASVPKATPWTFISLTQAQRMCAGAGKRLPTANEWYQFALGTMPEGCIVEDSSLKETGTPACLSGVGVYDTVGNAWEWVDEQVAGNVYRDRELPEEGYVHEVDVHGIALVTAKDASDHYGKDYFWSKKGEEIYGMIRGGFYGSGSDAGLFTVNAAVSTSFAAPGVGFRCVKDVL